MYKAEKFENCSSSTRILNICQASGYSAVLIGYSVAIVAQIWYCHDVNFQLRDSAPTLGIMLLTIQLGISLATMTIDVKHVNEIITNLQQIIRKSE